MRQSVSLSNQDWSLHRKGPVDQARHNEKVKEAIKDNLRRDHQRGVDHHLRRQAGRQGADPLARAAAVPLRRQQEEQRGAGRRASHKPGDVLGDGEAGPGKGHGAGDQPGIDYFEADVTVDELAELMFEDLELPNLKRSWPRRSETDRHEFKDIRKSAPWPLSTSGGRSCRTSSATPGPASRASAGLTNDDLRFKTWTRGRAPSRATRSSSRCATSRARWASSRSTSSRTFYFWMVRFLRTKYDKVEIVFITHHTEAKEVDEDTFFKLGESGGTKVSSAYQLALKIIQQRYNPSRLEHLPVPLLRRRQLGRDGQPALRRPRRADARSCATSFGYGEIREGGYGSLQHPDVRVPGRQEPESSSA